MRLRQGTTLRILALENQNYVDYTMPYRCMEYDALEYGKQLKEQKRKNRGDQSEQKRTKRPLRNVRGGDGERRERLIFTCRFCRLTCNVL